MDETLTNAVLRRLDREERPIYFGDSVLEKFAEDEVAQLFSRGVLKNTPRPVELDFRTERRPLKPVITLQLLCCEAMIHGLIETIRQQNGISDEVTEHGENLFVLGMRKVGETTTKVSLSLRNQDQAKFLATCERVSESDGKRAVLLVPFPVLLSPKEKENLKKWRVRVVFLSHHVTAESWKLPLDEPQQGKSHPPTVLRIARGTRQVFYKGIEVEITRTQYGLLLNLAEHVGEFVNYENLFRKAAMRDADLEFDFVSWAKSHKSNLMINLRKLVDRERISRPEIDALIQARHQSYKLDLQKGDVEIV